VNEQQLILLAVVLGLTLVVFVLDWTDRRRNQRTISLLSDFINNPEVRRLATGVSEDTPVGMTFVAPQPEPDPHTWIVYFVGREEMEIGADWPFYIVEKWERNEINETRYLDKRVLSVPEVT
jgi:hypothetical protein